MKNSNDTIGNRTRDLPAFSIVRQPTVPSRDSLSAIIIVIIIIIIITTIITNSLTPWCRVLL